MTERLTALLNLEADQLDVPPPPAAAVLGRGRALRRRRRTTQAVAGVAALAVIGSGVAFLQGSEDLSGDAVDPAGQSAPATPDLGAVFAIGNTVYLDDGTVSATVDDRSVKSLYYTSAGLLVRHGNNPNSDGGGPQRFSLVSPDGAVTPLGLETEETVHATDPAQSYVAYAQEVDGEVHVLVRDVTSDDEVADVTVPGAGGGFYPLSLDGDRVYLRAEDAVYVVDWRTGEVQESDTLTSEIVARGRAVDGYGENPRVVDVATGRVLASAELDPEAYGYFVLSPDGSAARLFVQEDLLDQNAAPPTTTVYDLASGLPVTVPGSQYDVGWTTDGDLFEISETGMLTTCIVSTGVCSEQQLDLRVAPDARYETATSSDDLVLGGVTRES